MQENTSSSGLTFHHVSKVYGTNQVVRDLDFPSSPENG